MTAEGEIRRARDSYVQGWIDVEELESRVWDALTGAWSPTSAVSVVLKEQWTDAPGGVLVYRPSSHEERVEYVRARLKDVVDDSREQLARVQRLERQRRDAERAREHQQVIGLIGGLVLSLAVFVGALLSML